MSFLGLPFELRIAIYEYLIPNDHVSSCWFNHRGGPPPTRGPVRHDKQPCCPAILRLNRQIYDEVISMFYGTASFEINISGDTCFFANEKFLTEDLENTSRKRLPPGFRFVRILDLTINFDQFTFAQFQSPRLQQVPKPPLLPPGTILITECLSMGPYELRQITIHDITPSKQLMPEVVIGTLADRGKQFQSILKQFLDPLRQLREVDLSFDNLPNIGGNESCRWYHTIRSRVSTREALRIFTRLERIRMHALQRLAKYMSQPA